MSNMLQVPSSLHNALITGRGLFAKVKTLLGFVLGMCLLIGFLQQYIFVSKNIDASLKGLARGMLYLALLPGWSFSLALAPLAASSHQLCIAIILSAGVYLLLTGFVYAVCRKYSLSLGHILSSPRVGVLVQVGILILIVFPLLFAQAPFVWPDSSAYMARALNISKGLGYTDFGVPVTGRGPVYPFLISIAFRLFGATVESGLLVPKLVGVLNFLVIYWMGRSLFGGWAGFIGAVLAISCDTLRYYFFTSHLLDGTLALFMNLSLLILFVALERSKYWLFALAGISLCGAVLIKETGILWLPVPLIVLLLSKKYRTAKNFVGVWLSTATFFITLYPWMAYLYSVNQKVFLLNPRGDHSNVWLAVNMGMGLYLLIGIAAVFYQKRNPRLFSRYASHFGQRAPIVFPIGGVTLLVAAMVGSAYRYTERNIFSLSFYSATIDYLQDIIRPVFGSLFVFVIFAWCLTLIIAFRSEEHRLPAIPFLFVVPLLIHLSRFRWDARNYFMIFLLSYLLLGHYLDRLARWIVQTAEGFIHWPKGGAVAGSVMLMGLCLLVSRPPTLVMEQFTRNRLVSEEQRYTPSGLNVDNRVVHACAEWVKDHVEPGTPMLFFSAWSEQLYFLLDARYPITLLRSNYMGGTQFLDYLLARPEEKILYVQHIMSDPARFSFYVYTERELHQVIDREKIAYLVIGDRNLSLLETLDFFQMQPAFEQVFKAEENNFGTAIIRVKPELLTACPACPTVVEESVLHGLLELVKSAGMDEYEFLERLGPNIRPSIRPTLVGKKQQLANAYVELGQIYRDHGDMERALIAYQRAVALDPKLRIRYAQDIQALHSLLLEYYSSGEGERLEIPFIVQKELPALVRDINHARGQPDETVLVFRNATSDDVAPENFAVTYKLLNHFVPSMLENVEKDLHPFHLWTIDSEISTLLFQHPTSSYSFAVDLPSGKPALACDIALPSEVWYLDKGDGVQFDINLYDASGTFNPLFSTYVNSQRIPDDRKWNSWGVIPLGLWAGQTVTITFSTTPGPDGSSDYDEMVPVLVSNHVFAGNTYLVLEEWDQAIREYREALKLNPGDPLAHYGLAQAHLGLARAYQAQGEVDRAVVEYERFVSANPDAAWLRFELAEAYVAQGETEKATTQCWQIIKLEPDKADTYVRRLSELYKINGELDKAIALLREASSRDSEAVWPHLELGHLYREEGQLAEAIAEYQQAIKLEPKSARAYIFLSNLYKAEDRVGEAIAPYRTAARRNPAAAWPHIELGKIYLEQAGLD